MRHECREQNPPPVHYRLNVFASRLCEGVQIGHRIVDAVILSTTDAASQKAVVNTAQHIVVARLRALCDAAVQYCLDYIGPYHSGFEIEGKRSVGRKV